MAGSSVPNTATRPTTPSNTTVASLRKRLETLENQVKRINANRTPAPLLVHQLANTGPMAQVQDGQSLIYNADSGQYEPGSQTNFVLGNYLLADIPANIFTITSGFFDDPGFGGYYLEMFANAGFVSGDDGQAIFQFGVGKSTSIGLLQLGVDTGASSLLAYADTILFGEQNTDDFVVPGAGLMGFFGEGPGSQPNVVGSKGGNAALTSLLTQLADMGLVKDSST